MNVSVRNHNFRFYQIRPWTEMTILRILLLLWAKSTVTEINSNVVFLQVLVAFRLYCLLPQLSYLSSARIAGPILGQTIHLLRTKQLGRTIHQRGPNPSNSPKLSISNSARWRHFFVDKTSVVLCVPYLVRRRDHAKSQNTRYVNDVAKFVYLHINQ